MLRRVWFPGLILLFFIFLLIEGSLALTADAMIFPWIIGGLGCVLLLAEIVREARGTEPRISGETKNGQDLGQLKVYLPGIGWLVAILPAIYFLGLSVTIPLYLLLYMKSHGERWTLSLIFMAVTGAFFYFVFVVALKVSFNEGLLLSYFMP